MSASPSSAREHRVLLIPATRRDGDAICAFLRKHRIQCDICTDVAQAARAVGEDAGVLVLTDQVFAAEGSHLVVEALSRQPSWSDLPVVVLSKVGDESRLMSEVVGRMTNVTLLDRPASTRTLLSAIQAALRSRSKQYQIRDQLAALQDAERALRDSDRRKDEFLAMLAHELRNPLAPIRTAADLLPRLIASGDPRATATSDMVSRQARQLTRLVDDLLDVSRVTQGRIAIQRSPVELAAVVSQALESVDAQIKEKRHTVHTAVKPGVYVSGDGARLVQCVSNILTNAAKYTDRGGKIDVTLAVEGARAVVSISDNGVGIPAELLPRVFELFVQNERSLDRSQGGLGIGLSIVRRLIEMQGGEVSASSPGAGRGSTFKISLPAIEPPAGAKSAKSATVRTPLRVLIVDDNEDAADSLAMLLAIDGHTAQAVYAGEAAIELAPSFNADLILLDIGLPSMDGYEVARRLRAAGINSMLVALTGYGQKEDVQRALKAGFSAHVVKPVELSNLQKVMLGLSPSSGDAAQFNR
jgi:signal transduction histidine kinase/ActR/RegA family two-component response regulator